MILACQDSKLFLGTKNDFTVDIVFCDPPYGLGSEVIIRPDGKPDYSKAADFMSKWDMPTGKYWEDWFKEAYRTLKHGGYCVMYGMDRQLLLFKYYAALAGFSERQSLYWYFISNFPKASDLSKNLDKNLGTPPIDTGVHSPISRPNVKEDHYQSGKVGKDFNFTRPNSDLAKKYDGYKYSVSPLKQCQEVVMIFEKCLTLQEQFDIVILYNVRLLLWLITTKIQNNGQALGIDVSDAARISTFHLAEGLLTQRGNLFAETSADLLKDTFANVVEKDSTDPLRKSLDSVLRLATQSQWKDLGEQTTHNGLVEELKGETAMCLSVVQKTNSNTSLSIELLWLNILVGLSEMMKMSTIETDYETITELRTLSFCLMENISPFITKNGFLEKEKLPSLDVNAVAKSFISVIARLLSLQGTIVQEPVGDGKPHQQNNTVMVFQKPYKSGSCLHDTLAYENGDKTCCCGALAINQNRCPASSGDIEAARVPQPQFGTETDTTYNFKAGEGRNGEAFDMSSGRYPAQTFVSPEAGEVLDRQSGKGIGPSMRAGDRVSNNDGILPWNRGRASGREVKGAGFTDTGGCSKILHKCPYEEGEMDLYYYCPKVSKQERNQGCEEMPDEKYIQYQTGNGCSGEASNWSKERNTVYKNIHPTLKPISLNERILRLFKTPNPQKILYPFAGSGSEVIGGIRAGFTDWEGCELNPEYVTIAEARIKHWSGGQKQTLF